LAQLWFKIGNPNQLSRFIWFGMPTQLNGYAKITLQQPYWLQVMKVILILASLLALAPMVRADEVVVRHEPTVVVHEHYHHYYHRHHYAHHDVIVVHPN
jgi:hypothetical protein